ncbi:hypothetical protein GVO57_03075 [Sphingomonas changnyeongensis]|uniref:GTPase n=1 Tax=Sphingomonas changnyeongensis TaxID=2698679 RepID=A0A7Z2NV30_9SPHN|nr:hypothetical protein [Sphingomonas changnyeongensis]QHL89996.1 hypothetical protein GVO57_03075 [Sphingomonas changnyeongensis]
MPAPVRLVFVYNARAGLVAGALDSLHKLVSPATYPCSLCAVTYGLVRIDPRWRAWLATTAYDTVFHHRPDFRAAYPAFADLPLPAVLADRGDGPAVLLSADDLAAITTPEALIAAIEARLG